MVGDGWGGLTATDRDTRRHDDQQQATVDCGFIFRVQQASLIIPTDWLRTIVVLQENGCGGDGID